MKVRPEQWAAVDWKDRDADIARRLGVSRQLVWRERRRLGKSGPRDRGNPGKLPRAIEEARGDPGALLALAGLSDVEIARRRLFGISSPSTVARLRRTLGIAKAAHHTVRVFPAWLVNWDLPNTDLDRIWGLAFNHAAIGRGRKKAPRPRWSLRGGKVPTDPAYRAAVEAERRKAEGWRPPFYPPPKGPTPKLPWRKARKA